jgi:protein ImuB
VRQRVIERAEIAPGEGTARKPALLRAVSVQPAARTAAEFWLGVHLAESPSQVLLERLAIRAQRFTPRVSLVPPDGLLLEVKGSLHLFNGVEGLRRALESECVLLGVKPATALCPTPLAALVAARAADSAGLAGRSDKPCIVTALEQLVGQLAPLPLTSLRWSPETLERLAHMGVRTIGEALRLPRAGFARRFGTDHLATLDRLSGRAADLRERFRARERFRRKRDLTYELESHEAILKALEPLFKELGKFLRERQCGIVQLECLLRHRHAPTTSCVLRLAAPGFDADRLRELLGERLSPIALPEPVRSCELRSGALIRNALASGSLWQPGEHGGHVGGESPELIERLRARLGPEAVYGLKVLPGHRPENAWGVAEPQVTRDRGSTRTAVGGTAPGRDARGVAGARAAGGTAAAADATPWPVSHRPAWLLPSPRLLSERDGLPWRRGPLRLMGDPERIETGWWDGGEIARDYYTAVDIHGVRMWVFRERTFPHKWFLHGVFG